MTPRQQRIRDLVLHYTLNPKGTRRRGHKTVNTAVHANTNAFMGYRFGIRRRMDFLPAFMVRAIMDREVTRIRIPASNLQSYLAPRAERETLDKIRALDCGMDSPTTALVRLDDKAGPITTVRIPPPFLPGAVIPLLESWVDWGRRFYYLADYLPLCTEALQEYAPPWVVQWESPQLLPRRGVRNFVRIKSVSIAMPGEVPVYGIDGLYHLRTYLVSQTKILVGDFRHQGFRKELADSIYQKREREAERIIERCIFPDDRRSIHQTTMRKHQRDSDQYAHGYSTMVGIMESCRGFGRCINQPNWIFEIEPHYHAGFMRKGRVVDGKVQSRESLAVDGKPVLTLRH